MAMYGDTSIDMMLNVLPGSLTGIFALNAGLSSINQQFQNMTKAVDNHFGIVDATIVSATALVLQFAKSSADAFGEYEQGMKIVQAVSGQSSSAVAELGQQINQFSVQYRMDISELTEGLQTLGRAGLKSASEQTEVLENGLQTAKLEGRDLNSVLEELIQNTTLLGGDLKSSTFGEQSEYVNDLLVATSMTAPINTHDVSETLKYSGGIAAAAGANIESDEGKEILEDYMAAIAAFAQKGVKGSIAGTALRAFFNKPATQDSSVIEGLSMIGLKPEYLWEDDQETMKPVSEQISLIQNQMNKKGISKMDQLQIWSKIVGGKMGQQMMKLEGSDIREITKDIKEANSAENLATQSMQTYQAAMKQTSEAGQVAFRAFGEHVARFLAPIAQALTPILEMLSNPIASTTAFIAFLKIISLAINSIKKVFSGLKLELGIIKSEFQSLVLNQPQRRGIMNGRMWGGGTLRRETDELQEKKSISLITSPEKIKAISNETQKIRQDTSIATSTGNQGVTAIYNKLEETRRNLSAAINRTKEFVEEIKMMLSSGVNNLGQRSNQIISETSGRMKSEYTSTVNSVVNTGKTKVDSAIRSSASTMNREFQNALNRLTYTPKIKDGGAGKSLGTIRNYRDIDSKSFAFYNQLSKQTFDAEKEYKRKMAIVQRNRVPLDTQNTLIRNKKDVIKEKLGIERNISQLNSIIKKLNADIAKQDQILQSNASKSAKLEAQLMREHLVEEKKLREEERILYQQELRFKEDAIREISKLIAAIKQERLALLANTTTVPIIPPVGGGAGPVNMNNIPSNYQPTYTNDPISYNYGRYNLPPEYRPTIGGSSYTPTVFKDFDRGQGLLAKLRQENIAMDKETQKALGITNKELIRFYEELIQVNAALNNLGKTTHIVGGKESIGKTFSQVQEDFEKKVLNDTLYQTKGNLVPIYSSGGKDIPTIGDTTGLKALFGDLNRTQQEIFDKMYSETSAAQHTKEAAYVQSVSGYNRYNLPPEVGKLSSQVQEGIRQNQRADQISSVSSPGSAMALMNQMKVEEESVKQKQEALRKEKSFSGKVSKFRSSLTGGSKGLKGFGNAIGKVTNFLGGKGFAAMMAFDVAMQIYTAAHNDYIKKIEEATQKIDDMQQAVSDAENIFFNGKDEEGEAKITGWSEEHPDATAEEKEDALLGAYADIYDHSAEGLSALDANTQQLAIATEELKRANKRLENSFMDGSFFAANGFMSKAEGNQIASGNIDFMESLFGSRSEFYGKSDFSATKYVGKDFFDTGDIVLSENQKKEEYPYSTELAPALAYQIWQTEDFKKGFRGALGNAGYEKLTDYLSSFRDPTFGNSSSRNRVGTPDPFETSAFGIHGSNLQNYFKSNADQNRLQMALKNFSKDFSKLAKQTRRFEKATGRTALGSLQNEMKKTKNMKQALKNLQVTDPKLVNYIKSLAIKTGMDEQQILMAAQLQQLQEMHEIGQNQVAPRMEHLVNTAYQQVAYGGQTLAQVGGSGSGAVGAAQNAAAIANILGVMMEQKLDEKSYQEYLDTFYRNNPSGTPRYQTAEEFAAASKGAYARGENNWLSGYYERKQQAYAATNYLLYNPDMSSDVAAQRAADWWKGVAESGASVGAIQDTLRKGAQTALATQVLDAYDAGLDQEEGDGGSGGGGGGSGSGSGDKDKSTGTRRERVDLVLCSKKEIPKLNVNLFKKPPSFTILNKNFKLRDVKINSEDKPKAIMAAIKNSFIDIQKRTDPKIIQDEDAVYDPKAATDGTNVPSGSAKTKTDNNSS